MAWGIIRCVIAFRWWCKTSKSRTGRVWIGIRGYGLAFTLSSISPAACEKRFISVKVCINCFEAMKVATQLDRTNNSKALVVFIVAPNAIYQYFHEKERHKIFRQVACGVQMPVQMF